MEGKEKNKLQLQPSNNSNNNDHYSGLPSYASTSQLYCGICANEILPPMPPEKWETLPSRALLCCGREVCGDCIEVNPRFGTAKFAPTGSSDGIPTATGSFRPLPPPYTPAAPPPSYPTSSNSDTPIHHYIRPTDSLISISLLYSVPLQTLRTHNRLYTDTLLHARRTLVIPPPYTGPQLSRPTADEAAAEQRKRMVKRFQVRTKCTDWETAEVYLSMAEWDEEAAVGCWEEDERWVKENPMEKGKGKGEEESGKGLKWGLRAFGY